VNVSAPKQLPAVKRTDTSSSATTRTSTPVHVSAAVAPTPIISAKPTTQVMEDAFGRTKSEPTQELEQLTAKVKSVRTNQERKQVITLENGQIWRQTDNDPIVIKIGHQIIIEKASLGSFLLNIEGSNRKMRVKRVE